MTDIVKLFYFVFLLRAFSVSVGDIKRFDINRQGLLKHPVLLERKERAKKDARNAAARAATAAARAEKAAAKAAAGMDNNGEHNAYVICNNWY